MFVQCPASHICYVEYVEKQYSLLWKLKDTLQFALRKAEDNIQLDTMITAVLWIWHLHLVSRKKPSALLQSHTRENQSQVSGVLQLGVLFHWTNVSSVYMKDT